jgi:hypothetical protein
MVPGVAMVALISLAGWVNMAAERNGWAWMLWCSFFLIGAMPLLGIQAWAAFSAYYRHLDIEDYASKRNALSTTAETRLFEYARSMHPETVKLLLLQRKVIWRVKEAKPGEMADWVLDADPTVRVAFVEYVLENSTKVKMMPINTHLSEGAYTFDPEKLVTDREQYHALHKLLINRGMATEAFGNQPGQWIEPWNPDLVAARWGIRLESWEEAPAPSHATRSTIAQDGDAGKQPAPVVEREVSDADMVKIKALTIGHEQMSVSEFVQLKKAKIIK